jgi:hypothetical protein
MDRVLRFLRVIAVWLVVAAWLLVVATAVMAFSASVGSAINATYFPYHPRTPIDRAIAQVWQYAALACLSAAVASSVALALRRRLVASTLIITIWGTFLIYSGWALSVMKPGPEYFERYLGTHTYRISWHYAPLGLRGLHQQKPDEFDVNLCLNTFRGGYGGSCGDDDTRIVVSLRASGFTARGRAEENFWQTRVFEMKQAEPRYDHDAYLSGLPPLLKARGDTTLYYVRHDGEGRLMRLVVCPQFGNCMHHALVEDYALSYEARDSSFSKWETTDRKLAELINSWRSR